MSSILLSNPFVTPQQPNPGTSEAAPPLALPALQSSQGSQGAGLGNPGADSGRGQNPQKRQDRTVQQIERPTDASRASVVDAQINTPKSAAVKTSLPEVPMPDPLPTSPFLKPG